LRIEPLFRRLESGAVREVILGLNADIEGETTAQYLTKQIQAFCEQRSLQDKIKITRLAQGLPAGAELEYMDEMTLLRALENRQSILLS
jgi:recombination protein RecR